MLRISDLTLARGANRLLEGASLHDVVCTVVERLAHASDMPAAPAARGEPAREAATLDTVSAEASFGAEMESGEL